MPCGERHIWMSIVYRDEAHEVGSWCHDFCVCSRRDVRRRTRQQSTTEPATSTAERTPDTIMYLCFTIVSIGMKPMSELWPFSLLSAFITCFWLASTRPRTINTEHVIACASYSCTACVCCWEFFVFYTQYAYCQLVDSLDVTVYGT